jgi:glyceraldehyde 3-phosphate dehydrogenase
MPISFAINGLGRIGRCLARIAHERPDLELVAINDVAPAPTLARLLQRDSVHGRFAARVEAEASALHVDDRRVATFQEREPQRIPWPAATQIVVEATGRHARRALAARHLRAAGPSQVLISAVAEDADLMLCPGLPLPAGALERASVVSSASCTTHCLALLLQVLDEAFGIDHALMSETHGYTANQNLVDAVHEDPRRGRAAAINIVPTYSAAPAACERLLPQLRGRLAGQAVRVPTPDVALLDLVAQLERPATVQSLNDALRAAARGRLEGLLAFSDEPLVSSDYLGDPHSAIVDAPLTHVVGGRLARVMAWYDNEWGYANRLADFLTLLGGQRCDS